MRKLLTLVLIGAFLAACGGDGKQTTDVSVALSEWRIAPSVEEARPGTILFQVRNEGSMSHQLIVLKSDLPAEQLPVANGSIVMSQVRVLESIDPIAAGATARVRFEGTPGKYVLVCNVPGHYQQGMTTSFLIEP